jgi:hypothetical protein
VPDISLDQCLARVALGHPVEHRSNALQISRAHLRVTVDILEPHIVSLPDHFWPLALQLHLDCLQSRFLITRVRHYSQIVAVVLHDVILIGLKGHRIRMSSAFDAVDIKRHLKLG